MLRPVCGSCWGQGGASQPSPLMIHLLPLLLAELTSVSLARLVLHPCHLTFTFTLYMHDVHACNRCGVLIVWGSTHTGHYICIPKHKCWLRFPPHTVRRYLGSLPAWQLWSIPFQYSLLMHHNIISLSPSTTHSFPYQHFPDGAPFTISSLQIDMWA